jgi:hypothetical protein
MKRSIFGLSLALIAITVLAACNKGTGGAKVSMGRKDGAQKPQAGKPSPSATDPKKELEKATTGLPPEKAKEVSRFALDMLELRPLLSDGDLIYRQAVNAYLAPDSQSILSNDDKTKGSPFSVLLEVIKQNLTTSGIPKDLDSEHKKRYEELKKQCSEKKIEMLGEIKPASGKNNIYSVGFRKCHDPGQSQIYELVTLVKTKSQAQGGKSEWRIEFKFNLLNSVVNGGEVSSLNQKFFGKWFHAFHKVEEVTEQKPENIKSQVICELKALSNARLKSLKCQNLAFDVPETEKFIHVKKVAFENNFESTESANERYLLSVEADECEIGEGNTLVRTAKNIEKIDAQKIYMEIATKPAPEKAQLKELLNKSKSTAPAAPERSQDPGAEPVNDGQGSDPSAVSSQT